jgi:hypothetical protein
MSFVNGETNKVDIRKVLRELEHLQERINERDADRVVEMTYWTMMYRN